MAPLEPVAVAEVTVTVQVGRGRRGPESGRSAELLGYASRLRSRTGPGRREDLTTATPRVALSVLQRFLPLNLFFFAGSALFADAPTPAVVRVLGIGPAASP
ncbi:hypothetical protein HCJ76_10885 [Streptomyces sp. MC1]|uniref:hypothetical protein n=1 Tax=Streptomyces sp. MC1 TaxID=295105 RepID=UPI0018CACC6B|nr:hypothetical protein [Streptomyces sp. MC1]MBG7698569.1 hypothetical protein [Streptomyces sp. MC1]